MIIQIHNDAGALVGLHDGRQYSGSFEHLCQGSDRLQEAVREIEEEALLKNDTHLKA